MSISMIANFMMIEGKLCPSNCSGNGDCLTGGTCLCQVQYTGWSCSDSNLRYYVTFAVLFYLISFATIVQLIMRIRSEVMMSPSRSLLKACKLDIQKLVYLFVICATGSRAVYFTFGIYDNIPEAAMKNLFTVFYPFVLSGFSLIICYWAESFHLVGLQLDKPRFLTKSICGFLSFNVLVYVMLAAQVISNNVFSLNLASRIDDVFNGCYAFLMFFVLVFFLIYGVEIFYKVKGAFMQDEGNGTSVNVGQLYQSRMALCVQAGFQLAVTMFLMSEVLGKMWKHNMSIGEKNIVEIAFHIAELGCVLWFPCALWNVNKPGKLWILNPQNLLTYSKTSPEDVFISNEVTTPGKDILNDENFADETEKFNQEESECWICYDKDKQEPMIQPCNCKGDMKLVHHDCLKVWLVEKSMIGAGSKNTLECSVCKVRYTVVSDGRIFWTPNKVQFRAWAQTFLVIATMATLPVVLFLLWHKIHQAVAKTALVIFLILGEYCLLRLLGFNFVKAYNITRTRALRILGMPEIEEQVPEQIDVKSGENEVELIPTGTVDDVTILSNRSGQVEVEQC